MANVTFIIQPVEATRWSWLRINSNIVGIKELFCWFNININESFKEFHKILNQICNWQVGMETSKKSLQKLHDQKRCFAKS